MRVALAVLAGLVANYAAGFVFFFGLGFLGVQGFEETTTVLAILEIARVIVGLLVAIWVSGRRG